MPSPRHRSHRGAMIPTGHPGSVTLQKDPTGAQVQSPPPSPPRPPVIARRAPPATPTPMAGLGRRTDRDDQRRSHLIEIDRFDHGILQPERSLQYPLLFAPRSVSCLRSRQIARKRRKQTGCGRGWSTQTPTDPSGEPKNPSGVKSHMLPILRVSSDPRVLRGCDIPVQNRDRERWVSRSSLRSPRS